jgi:hypothetical protein
MKELKDPKRDDSFDAAAHDDDADQAAGTPPTAPGRVTRTALLSQLLADPGALAAKAHARGGAPPPKVPGAVAPAGLRGFMGALYRKPSGSNVVREDEAQDKIQRATRSSGMPLPDLLRRKLERSLGVDLGSVRLHTGSASADAAASVSALAYTVGQDIHFASGQFDPNSPRGQRLIAHEVAHTVQQQGAGTTEVSSGLTVSQPGERHEVEADRFADGFVQGVKAPVGAVAKGSVARAVVHRKGNPVQIIARKISGNEQAAKDALRKAGPNRGTVEAAIKQAFDKDEAAEIIKSVPPGAGEKPPEVKGKDAAKEKKPAKKAADGDAAGPGGKGGDSKAGGGKGGGKAEGGKAKGPSAKGPDDLNLDEISAEDLGLIHQELIEHEMWAQSGAVVGEAGSADRAAFIAQNVGAGAISGFTTGLIMGAGSAIVGQLAARYVPIPGVGAMIAGGFAAYGLITKDWGAFGDAMSAMGQGDSEYERLANTINGISEILSLVCDIANVIAGIIGAISAVMWLISIVTVGAASPLAATLSSIALAIVSVTGLIGNINDRVLAPMVLLFRALHAFTSDADPREIEAQAGDLQAGGSKIGGMFGSAAGGAAVGAAGKGVARAKHKLKTRKSGGGGGGAKGKASTKTVTSKGKKSGGAGKKSSSAGKKSSSAGKKSSSAGKKSSSAGKKSSSAGKKTAKTKQKVEEPDTKVKTDEPDVKGKTKTEAEVKADRDRQIAIENKVKWDRLSAKQKFQRGYNNLKTEFARHRAKLDLDAQQKQEDLDDPANARARKKAEIDEAAKFKKKRPRDDMYDDFRDKRKMIGEAKIKDRKRIADQHNEARTKARQKHVDATKRYNDKMRGLRDTTKAKHQKTLSNLDDQIGDVKAQRKARLAETADIKDTKQRIAARKKIREEYDGQVKELRGQRKKAVQDQRQEMKDLGESWTDGRKQLSDQWKQKSADLDARRKADFETHKERAGEADDMMRKYSDAERKALPEKMKKAREDADQYKEDNRWAGAKAEQDAKWGGRAGYKWGRYKDDAGNVESWGEWRKRQWDDSFFSKKSLKGDWDEFVGKWTGRTGDLHAKEPDGSAPTGYDRWAKKGRLRDAGKYGTGDPFASKQFTLLDKSLGLKKKTEKMTKGLVGIDAKTEEQKKKDKEKKEAEKDLWWFEKQAKAREEKKAAHKAKFAEDTQGIDTGQRDRPNPKYPDPPPFSPEELGKIKEGIVAHLAKKAEAEQAAADAAAKKSKAKGDTQGLTKTEAKADETMPAVAAHKAAVARKDKANQEQKGREASNTAAIGDYHQKKAGFAMLMTPLQAVAQFEWVGDAIDSPFLKKMGKDSAKLKKQLDAANEAMAAQKAGAPAREKKHDAQLGKVKDADAKNQQAKTDLDKGRADLAAVKAKSQQKEAEAGAAESQAKSQKQKHGGKADEGRQHYQKTAQGLIAWARAHRDARKAAYEVAGWKVDEGSPEPVEPGGGGGGAADAAGGAGPAPDAAGGGGAGPDAAGGDQQQQQQQPPQPDGDGGAGGAGGADAASGDSAGAGGADGGGGAGGAGPDSEGNGDDGGQGSSPDAGAGGAGGGAPDPEPD